MTQRLKLCIIIIHLATCDGNSGLTVIIFLVQHLYISSLARHVQHDLQVLGIKFSDKLLVRLVEYYYLEMVICHRSCYEIWSTCFPDMRDYKQVTYAY